MNPDADNVAAETVRLQREPFIDLVTYRRDGSAAHTPVWVSGDGATLFVSTFGDSYKVGRIRANDAVAVAACDGPGLLLPGERYVAARAEVLAEYGAGAQVAFMCQARRLRYDDGVSPPKRLRVLPAPAPSTVLWANLSVHRRSQWCRAIATTAAASVIVVASFLLLFFASYQQQVLQAGNLAVRCSEAGVASAVLNATDAAVVSLRTDDPVLFCYCTNELPGRDFGWTTAPLATLKDAGSRQFAFRSACPDAFCPRVFRLDPTTVVTGGYAMCGQWVAHRSSAIGITVAASLSIVFVNGALGEAMRLLTRLEAHHSMDGLQASLTVRLFVAQFINTAVLMLLINSPLQEVGGG